MWAYKAEFIKAIDGDGIVVERDAGCRVKHEIEIRLNGIDVYERYTEIGKIAKRWVNWTLSHASWINVYTVKEDGLNRWLADVTYELRGKYYDLVTELYIRKFHKPGSKWNTREHDEPKFLHDCYFGKKTTSPVEVMRVHDHRSR